MNKYKKLILFFLIFQISLFLSGCNGQRELDELAVVSGLGIDLDQKTGEIILTAQIIKAGKVGVSSEDSSINGSKSNKKSDAVWVIESRGETFFDAVRSFTFQSSRKLYFSHAKIIVFGKNLAKKGIKPYLNFLIKDNEPRNNILIAVAENRASEVMEISTDLEKIPAYGLAKFIETRTSTSQSTKTTIHEFILALFSKSRTATASYIQVIEEEGGGKKALIKGTSIFKNDKFIGTLNKTETRGLLWIKNKVEGGIIIINDPQGDKISIEIVNSNSQIKSKLKNNKISMELIINERGNIGENMGNFDLASSKMISYLEKQQNIIIEEEIRSALKKAYELNTDLFGFGDIIYKQHPEKWEEIEPHWNQYFKDIKVKIIVDSKIREVGMTIKSLTP